MSFRRGRMVTGSAVRRRRLVTVKEQEKADATRKRAKVSSPQPRAPLSRAALAEPGVEEPVSVPGPVAVRARAPVFPVHRLPGMK